MTEKVNTVELLEAIGAVIGWSRTCSGDQRASKAVLSSVQTIGRALEGGDIQVNVNAGNVTAISIRFGAGKAK